MVWVEEVNYRVNTFGMCTDVPLMFLLALKSFEVVIHGGWGPGILVHVASPPECTKV